MNEDYNFKIFQEDTEQAYLRFTEHASRPLILLGKNLLGQDQMDEIQIIVSEAIYKAYETRQSFKKLEEVTAWLRVTVKNKCINWLHYQKAKNRHKLYVLSRNTEIKDAVDYQNDLDAEKARLYLRQRVLNEVENLPPQQKAVINLYRQGFPPTEIAQKLGIAEKTVYATKSDAIKNIRKSLNIDPEMIIAVLFTIISVNDSTPV